MILLRCRSLYALVILASAMCWFQPDPPVLHGEDPKKPANEITYDAAVKQYALAPEDPYLQYVLLQVGKREGKLDEAAAMFERRGDLLGLNRGAGRRAGADLFSTFTGALAIQESLQLDTMRGNQSKKAQFDPKGPIPPPQKFDPKGPTPPSGLSPEPPVLNPPKLAPEDPLPKAPEPQPKDPQVKEAQPENPKEVPNGRFPRLKGLIQKVANEKQNRVDVTKLPSPAAKSHPWEKMLGEKKPEVGTLALYVPEEFWFGEFRSLIRMNELAGQGDFLSGHLFTQILGESRSSLTLERVKKQLGLLQLPPKAFESLEIEAAGATGSDLFLVEGSDVTVLVQSKKVAALSGLLDTVLKLSGKSEEGEYLGVKYTYRFAPDHTLNVYSATPKPDLHIRSNSLPAFKRVLETVVGKTADNKPVKRLGESAEFRYIRTLMPRGAAEEDGMIYMSDAFIHHMVSAPLKITESRRVQVYNHLKMIGHAALLYRTEYGVASKSLEELAEKKCAPGVFGKEPFNHPDGGKYSLSQDGMTGVCSKYGTIAAMTPCIERMVAFATSEEAGEYQDFLRDYNEYWRTFFDPIVVRIQVAEKQYRLETLILPLIDNSIYTEMARSLTGKPEVLDILPTPKREIGGLWMGLNRKPLIEWLGPEVKVDPQPEKKAGRLFREIENNLKQFGLAFHNYESAFQYFPPPAITSQTGKPLLSSRVAILPFIEQDNLYRQFKLDEPWDSEHNKKLISQMPKFYAGGSKTLLKEGKSVYVVTTGKDTLFPKIDAKVRINNIPDGTSNTIMILETAEEDAVIWTKPDDLAFDPKNPFKGLVRKDQDFIFATLCDGSITRISTKLSPKSMVIAVNPADGLPQGSDWPEGKIVVKKPVALSPKATVEFSNDMKQILLAMHGYHDANGYIPAAIVDKDGKPLLSWRVAMLPYIEEGVLYQSFKLDEPWDSPNNKPLAAKLPRIYAGLNAKLNADGRTSFVIPSGKAAWATSPATKLKLTDVLDGLSNTIGLVLADEDSAVLWTKPEDIVIDPKAPGKNLAGASTQAYLVGMLDGSVQQLSNQISAETLAGMFSPKGGEVITLNPRDVVPLPRGLGLQRNWWIPDPLDTDTLEQFQKYDLDINKFRRFVRDGMGDQIGLHLHDSSPLLDSDLGGNGSQIGLGGPETFGIAMLVQFLTRPASISMPIRDTKAVDEFLAELQKLYQNENIDEFIGSSWRRNLVDIYTMPVGKSDTIYVMTTRFVGLKWRLYWGRIGTGLYIANRPFILEDLELAHRERKPIAAKGETSHLLLKVRPENWKEVLPGYLLGWAEGERRAATSNLMMLTSVYRGWHDAMAVGSEPDALLLDRVQKVYGVRVFHPDGGKYILSQDGKTFESTLFGGFTKPKQPAKPVEGSSGDRFLKSFGGLRAAITFEEKGLRAVLTVERK